MGLIDSAKKGYLQSVKKLLDRGLDVNQQNKKGDTALILASLYGHLEVVKELIRHGADVNHQKNDGLTALMIASNYGYLKIIIELLNNGASLFIKNKKNETAYDICSDEKIKLFLKKYMLSIISLTMSKKLPVDITNKINKYLD